MLFLANILQVIGLINIWTHLDLDINVCYKQTVYIPVKRSVILVYKLYLKGLLIFDLATVMTNHFLFRFLFKTTVDKEYTSEDLQNTKKDIVFSVKHEM